MFQRDTLLGTFYIFLAAFCYAFLPIFTRWIYTYSDVNPWTVVFWRFLIGSVGAWLLVLVLGQQQQARLLKRAEIKTLLILGAVFAIAGMTAAVALENIPATTYTLLFYTYPAMVAVFAKLIGEFLGLQKWASVGLAFVGCMLTISAPIEVQHFTHLIFPLMNAAAYAVYLTIAGRFQVATGLAAGSISITTTFVALLPLALFTDMTPPDDSRAFLALLGLGTIATVLPIVFIFRGIRYIGSTNASILSTIEPVMTLGLAGLLLGEVLIWQQGIGGVLILASVILLHFPRRSIKEITSQ